jgi:chaperonin GroEL
VQKAIRQPIATIVANSGLEPSGIVEKILANPNINFGYDAMKDCFVDMLEAGIMYGKSLLLEN